METVNIQYCLGSMTNKSYDELSFSKTQKNTLNLNDNNYLYCECKPELKNRGGHAFPQATLPALENPVHLYHDTHDTHDRVRESVKNALSCTLLHLVFKIFKKKNFTIIKSAYVNNLRFFTNKCTHFLKTSNF